MLVLNRESPPKYTVRAPGAQNPFGDSKPSGDGDASSSNPFGSEPSQQPSNPFGASSNPFGDAAAAATNPFGDEGSVTLTLDDNRALDLQLCTISIFCLFVMCVRGGDNLDSRIVWTICHCQRCRGFDHEEQQPVR